MVAKQLHENGYSSKFGENQDRAKNGNSFLIFSVMEYLTKNLRINEAIEFLEPFANEDPTIVSLICDSILSVDKTKESIILLAKKIKEYPMLVNLLLK